ncbi:MAG: transposase [Burkholderia sp.]
MRSDDSDGQRLLAIIGATPEGEKVRVAIGDSYWESKESWCERLLDLKKRGLPAGPLLACGDGAMGFGSAMEEGFPQTKHQRCWFHKMSKRAQRAAEVQAGAREAVAASHLDGGPATRADALVGFNDFVDSYSAKYPKTAEKLTKDSDEQLAFYDFQAEHWQHLRTTNPIEQTFATVRHRTKRTRNCVSRAMFLSLAFKLIESAEQSWRRICAPEMLGGIAFKSCRRPVHQI